MNIHGPLALVKELATETEIIALAVAEASSFARLPAERPQTWQCEGENDGPGCQMNGILNDFAKV